MNCAEENSDSDDVPKRKNTANKSEWKQNVNKRKRMEGVEYLGISKEELCQKPSRQLGEPCSSLFCVKKNAKLSSVIGQRNKNRRDFLKKLLEELPKMESHYCRKDSKKFSFESDFSSSGDLQALCQRV
uniref:Homeobox protein Hox-A1 n=1 Tax=Zeugodacus cucurbitae TaxID=28588 RepID=A0A0A1WHP2_ZEUCU